MKKKKKYFYMFRDAVYTLSLLVSAYGVFVAGWPTWQKERKKKHEQIYCITKYYFTFIFNCRRSFLFFHFFFLFGNFFCPHCALVQVYWRSLFSQSVNEWEKRERRQQKKNARFMPRHVNLNVRCALCLLCYVAHESRQWIFCKYV